MGKLISILAMAVFAMLTVIGTSHAASFNFANYADTTPGEVGGQPLSFNEDGISLAARGFMGVNPTHAYLDGSIGGNTAGLGVCSTGLDGDGECNIASDDNVTQGEMLQLVFDTKVSIDAISFKDSNHLLTNIQGGTLDLSIDGSALGSFSIDPSDWDSAFAGLMGTVFEFTYVDAQFYLETVTVSAVPLPPALILFGAALAGLGALSRRRKQSKT